MYSVKRLLALFALFCLVALVAWGLQQQPEADESLPAAPSEPPPAAVSELAERLLACGAVQGEVTRPGWFAADLDGAFFKLFEERTQLEDTATPEASLKNNVLACSDEEAGADDTCYPAEKYVFLSLPIDSFRTTEQALIIQHEAQRFEAIPLPVAYYNGRCTDAGAGRTLSYGGQTLHLWTIWHQELISLCDTGELEEGEERWCSQGCELGSRSDILLHISPRAEVLTTWTLSQEHEPSDQVDPVQRCLGIPGTGIYGD